LCVEWYAHLVSYDDSGELAATGDYRLDFARAAPL